MSITGANLIGFQTSAKGDNSFQTFSPAKNEFLPGDFTEATEEELFAAVSLAEKAFQSYREVPSAKRAEFLDAIAEEILALGDELIERCVAESGLPAGRITGERGRTCGQMQLFAKLLRDGWWVDARIDKAQPDRQPLPKSDIRRILMPIGPVAVYGASNFPLAFSTAGGDTASALAAGCPVIVKAHPSHAGTNDLIASAINKAAQKTGMPEGVFSSLHLSNKDSVKLVQHPTIKAVGFTGSRKVGMILYNAAVNRPEPIPVFAEMSSINPFILMEDALKNQGEKIAKGLAGSVTLGSGQFCTNPGLVLAVDGDGTQAFLKEFAQQLSAAVPTTMLNQNICKAYTSGVQTLENTKGVKVLSRATQAAAGERHEGQAVAFTVSADEFLSNKQLSEEVFGPATVVVLSKDASQLHEVLQTMEGQLTATVHATEADEQALKPVVKLITQKAGRVIYGGYPTGVEVCHSMQHGGPFPSTTDSRATSVGSAAIFRFVRPVAFQDFPDHMLPDELKDANPLGILRLVDGNWTKD